MMRPHDGTGSSSEQKVRSGTSKNDVAVMATNDDAFESKIAAMDVGYFEDWFLRNMRDRQEQLQANENFALGLHDDVNYRQKFRREPVINRGTFGRVKIKQHVLEAAFADMSCSGERVQIISIGAGFDTFAFNLLRKKQNVDEFVIDYLEIDLEPVVKHKLEIGRDFFQRGDINPLSWRVQHSDRSSFHGQTHECGSQYWLKSCDLRDLRDLDRVLTGVGLRYDKPTVILAEMSLVYMEADDSDAVIKWFGQTFTGRRVFVCLEPVCGDDSFGKHMDVNVAARGSPLLGMRVYQDIEAQQKRFARNGWGETCRVRTMWDEWKRTMTGQRAMQLQKVEMLDEIEELELLLRHYCVVVAAAGQDCERLMDAALPKGQ